MKQIYIIKIGGNVIDQEGDLYRFLADFAAVGQNKILVHGGGKIASEIGQQMGLKPTLLDGRRVTDADTLRMVTMVYGGLVNKNIVSLLQHHGCDALGLIGADANIVTSSRRPVQNGVDFGFVGDVVEVKSQRLLDLITLGLTPVCAPLTHDGKGQILNTNADTIASAIASALAEIADVHLVYCFELNGVLADFSNKESVIPHLNREHYLQLKKDGIIAEGMKPKLDNAFLALETGVKAVTICHANRIASVLEGVKSGTSLSL